tara:strand:+ start:483 stop:1751 length:1269 start_codon:yes stop_codon:yes gene_type:complete
MIFNSTSEKFIFFKVPVLLFSFLPLFLISGPFLSDLSLSLISVLFIIYCLKKKNFSYFKKKYFYFFLIFWFYLILNSLTNDLNLDSLKISFFYFRFGVFVIAIVALVETDDRFVKYFFYCIFWCFLILIIDGYYQYFVGKNIIGFKTPNLNRVSSFFGEKQILGSYLSRFWPIFFGLSIFILKKKNKLFFILILIFILSEVLIFLSGDRTAFFYINLSAIFIILFSQKLTKLRLYTLISSLALILIISFYNPNAKERLIDHTLSQMNITNETVSEGKEIYIFSKEHNQMYLSAYKMFLDNKIFGVGIKNFRNYCDDENYKSEFSCSTHPHNTYVQILAETGLLGFIFLLFALFYFCKHIIVHIYRKIKGKIYFTDFEICILSGLAIYLWPFIPNGNVFNNWINITLFINFPFLILSRKLIKN